ncbi:MAG: 4'-phosphopantetheinyl transferase superfamily protein [Rickettsiales bacterium]|nr:4'-phosphopantetheinyl transferase superfamily protein [Rickettsiales bacterium]
MFAVGCDIERVERFEERPAAFYAKIFTPNEIAYCERQFRPREHFAARFCAKEAVVKALGGLGIKGVHYKEIEIGRNGATTVAHLSGIRASVSLSHAGAYAMATAMLRISPE